MGHQVYFLQSEEDVKEFLTYMGVIDIFFLHEGKCVHADEMHNDVMEQMSSYLHRYIIVPGGRDGIDGEITGAFTGVEYLICSKGNPRNLLFSVFSRPKATFQITICIPKETSVNP